MKAKMSKPTLTLTWIVASILTIVMLGGCANKGLNPVQINVKNGWRYFAAGEYDKAIESFRSAQQVIPSEAEPYLGIGWSYGRMGQLDSVWVYLDSTLRRESTSDATALQCAMFLAMRWHESALAAGNHLLVTDSLWVFVHDSTVDHRDIRVIMAQAAFQLGELYYAEAQDALNQLDPGNGLDPRDSATWHGYPTYTVALMHAIALADDLEVSSRVLQ